MSKPDTDTKKSEREAKRLRKEAEAKVKAADKVKAEAATKIKSKLTQQELEDVNVYGSARVTIDRICEIGMIGPSELSRKLGVSRAQITNYRNGGRMVDYFPNNGSIKVVAVERVVNEGVL